MLKEKKEKLPLIISQFICWIRNFSAQKLQVLITNIHVHCIMGMRQTDRQAHRQKDIQTEIQTNRYTGRQKKQRW